MRAHKYHAVPTELDGIKFHSKKEARRYGELKLLERAQKITALRLQVPFKLEVNGVLVTKYICDFAYIEDGQEIIEDCKGMRLPIFKIKSRLMKAIHGIEVRET